MQTANAPLSDPQPDPADASPDEAATTEPLAGGTAAATVAVDGAANLALIRDIEVRLSMEIGHTRLSIERLLSLTAGSVVELERLADEPLDVLVNGTLVARGEAVVIGDRFGIRLVDVLSPGERLGKLT